jgi:hypothetical protein
MIRNEPMLISASYFWSDAINAFMFNHGPMTPTLMDVVMLTGLNIHAPDRSFHLLEKTSFKIETKSIGGWKGYIGKNMKTGPVSVREHTAFLNMWLEKFIFCGKSVGPTSNNLKLAENLATGNPVALGKHLLGVSLSFTPSSVIQTQKEPADHQLGRPLVVYSAVAAHVYAQNYGGQVVRH